MKSILTVAQLMGADGSIRFGETWVKPGEYKVEEVQLHLRPHFEEFVGVAVLRMFGEEMFPGVGDSRVTLVNGGSHGHEDALTLLKKGVLQIGIGNGPFNEHETETHLALEEECGATLVAKLLRVDEDPCVAPTLKYALRSDTQPMAPMELSSVFKVLYDYHPQDEVISWGLKVVGALIMRQMDFFGAAKGALENALTRGEAGIEEVPLWNGRSATVVWVRAEEKGCAAYARSKQGEDAALVIHEDPSVPGRFYIPANKRAGLNLVEVVRMLRLAELRKKNGATTKVSEETFRNMGDEVSADVPQWFLGLKKTGSVFGGGSQSNDGSLRSVLVIAEVLDAVKKGLLRKPEFRREHNHGHHYGRRDDHRGQQSNRRPERGHERKYALPAGEKETLARALDSNK